MVVRMGLAICRWLLAIVGVTLVAVVLPLGVACCLAFGVAVATGLASIVLFALAFGGFVLAAYMIAPDKLVAALRGKPEGDPVSPQPEHAAVRPEPALGLN